jgi:hypothetical protein
VAALLAGMAVAVRVVAGCTPGVDCGTEAGYAAPQTMVLVGADDRTLWAGWVGCAQSAALLAVQRPRSVLLRVYWRRSRTFGCGTSPGVGVVRPALGLSLRVRLPVPLAGRRLLGPDGAALPWLDAATMLRFPSQEQAGMPPLRGLRRHPLPLLLPDPATGPLSPAVSCLALDTDPVPIRLWLDQCAGARPGAAFEGAPVRVRGRPGHVVYHAPGAPPGSGVDFAFRALWWVQDNRVVVLTSQRPVPDGLPLLPVAELVAVANGLSCLRPAACR